MSRAHEIRVESHDMYFSRNQLEARFLLRVTDRTASNVILRKILALYLLKNKNKKNQCIKKNKVIPN